MGLYQLMQAGPDLADSWFDGKQTIFNTIRIAIYERDFAFTTYSQSSYF